MPRGRPAAPPAPLQRDDFVTYAGHTWTVLARTTGIRGEVTLSLSRPVREPGKGKRERTRTEKAHADERRCRLLASQLSFLSELDAPETAPDSPFR